MAFSRTAGRVRAMGERAREEERKSQNKLGMGGGRRRREKVSEIAGRCGDCTHAGHKHTNLPIPGLD